MSERLAAVSSFGISMPARQIRPTSPLWEPFLRPVDLPAHRIEGGADAPSALVAPIGVAAADLDQRCDLRTVEIGTHHTHAL
jgi:hypothetical protein